MVLVFTNQIIQYVVNISLSLIKLLFYIFLLHLILKSHYGINKSNQVKPRTTNSTTGNETITSTSRYSFFTNFVYIVKRFIVQHNKETKKASNQQQTVRKIRVLVNLNISLPVINITFTCQKCKHQAEKSDCIIGKEIKGKQLYETKKFHNVRLC